MDAFTLHTSHTWDGFEALKAETASIAVSETPNGLSLKIEAPFHGDPRPTAAVGSLWELWNWEVVELFVVGPNDRYLEIEVGPHGHYLALRLHGERNIVDHGHPLDVSTTVAGERWHGIVNVPTELLPEKPWRVNGYAIHGTGDERRYLASFPVPGASPDYHRLACFRAVADLM